MAKKGDVPGYVDHFMRTVLIDPLKTIMILLSTGDIWGCLQWERTYISALPPAVRKDFNKNIDDLDSFFEKYYSTVSKHQHKLSTMGERDRLLAYEGEPLARSIHDTLGPLLYTHELFDALKLTPFFDPSLGKKSGEDKDRKGLPPEMSSSVEKEVDQE